MKTVSILLTFALLAVANQLAARLKRAGALPVRQEKFPVSIAPSPLGPVYYAALRQPLSR